VFSAASFVIPQRWGQPKRPSTDEWKNKMWYIHTASYNSALKGKEKQTEKEKNKIKRKEILTHVSA